MTAGRGPEMAKANSQDEVFIVGAARTPIGSLNGALAALPAPRLGAVAVAEAVRRAGLRPEQVGEAILGNVLSAGMGQAPARQAALGGGLPNTVPAVTVNKVCGSGLKAILLGEQAIRAGEAEIVVAGGMESMSQTPYLLLKARQGYRMGDGVLVDSMLHDGLIDAYNPIHMGVCGEMCAERYGVSRAEQDRFATQSYTRALEAQAAGRFAAEIVPVPVPGKRGETLVTEDEEPKRADLSRFAGLKPSFKEGGTITPANAPSVNDGAAAVVLASRRAVEELGLEPLASLGASATAAMAPEWFTIAPGEAAQKALKRADLTANDIDLFEINEAFAVVALVAARVLGIGEDRMNVNGGAVALGHPIGCTGARLVVTLLSAMRQQGARRGLAALCLGGGEGMALILERP